MTAVLGIDAPCPPWCDAEPGQDGGVFCGGWEKHVPGWPVGLPCETDPTVAEDGTVVTVGVTDVGGGELRLSLILRQPSGDVVHVPLSEDAAFELQHNLALSRMWQSRYDDFRPVDLSITNEQIARDRDAQRAKTGAAA